jgi:hypothetical protein
MDQQMTTNIVLPVFEGIQTSKQASPKSISNLYRPTAVQYLPQLSISDIQMSDPSKTVTRLTYFDSVTSPCGDP